VGVPARGVCGAIASGTFTGCAGGSRVTGKVTGLADVALMAMTFSFWMSGHHVSKDSFRKNCGIKDTLFQIHPID
jgi:hypothetical protein